MTQFSDKLRQARLRAGLTQRALADQLGVNYSALNRWETGVRIPRSSSTVKSLENALGIKLAALIPTGTRIKPIKVKSTPFTTELEKLRIAAGLSIVELGDLSTISAGSMKNIACGRNLPRQRTLDLLTHILGDSLIDAWYASGGHQNKELERNTNNDIFVRIAKEANVQIESIFWKNIVCGRKIQRRQYATITPPCGHTHDIEIVARVNDKRNSGWCYQCRPHSGIRNRNPRSSTGYRGVSVHGTGWRATFTRTGGERVSLGTYDDAEGAALAWDCAARKEKLPAGMLNFPDRNQIPRSARRKNMGASGTGIGYIGVISDRIYFKAYFSYQGKRTYIGIFRASEEAARAYDAKVLELGLDRPLNFPA